MKLRRVLFFLPLFATFLALAIPASAEIALPPPPQFNAKSYALMDFNSGQLLAERDASRHIEPASITKLMTAYIAFTELKNGRLHLNDDITISETAWKTGGSRMFVEVGTKVKLEDLIRGMIIQSGNDATVAIAEAVAGSVPSFAHVMNQYAQKLGMKDSHFTNADGMPDPQHYTSALDLALLGRALIRDFPEYYKYYSELEFTYNSITQHNRNKLLGTEPGVDGMKTGHTDSAGYCMVASGQRSGMRLISVVIGLESDKARTAASRELLNYGFRFFETTALYDATHPVDTVRVWKGRVSELPVGVARPLYVTTPRGQRNNLAIQAQVQDKVIAPLAAGSPLGSIQVSLGGVTIRKEPVVALKEVQLGSWWRRLFDDVRLRMAN